MTIREKATRLCVMIGVCSLGIYLAACDNGELPAGGKGAAKVELRFSASISDSPFTKAGQPPQPTITSGQAFSEGKHLFGMFVTREDETALADGSSDNMKSTLTVSGSKQAWTHTDKTGMTPISLAANNGENIIIKGYYPWIADATATAVPFDLSSTDPEAWTDLLYLSSPTDPQNITDGMAPVSLKFSHAFCWVTINLLQLSPNNTVKVKAVNIGNAYAGQGTIVNKGAVNLKTGKTVNSVSGPLKIDLGSQPIDLDTEGAPGASAAVFNFLVPPVMSPDIKNSDIVIEVTTLESAGTGIPEEEKVLTFPLSQTHLNQDNSGSTTLYGFQKGMHNTYHIVYNNSAMNLSLSGWQTVSIDEAKLGEGTANVTPTKINFFDLWIGDPTVTPNKLEPNDHRYHTYLGEVAENNNGEYRDITTKNGKLGDRYEGAVTEEPFQPALEAASSLAAGGAQISWKDKETGTLLAKQACAELREGGYTDWRLPRISECYMLNYPANLMNGKEYWSATEASATECYAVVKVKEGGADYWPKKFSKQESFYVRCVRDKNKPKPQK
ncbi:fimbrillin family protein [Parabacteroides goldsteinii]|uniref:fimbrillin family protein n=1 Tax=Parabacteroides goldsteinii TaxID=328812 RepID=UPI0032B113E4